MNIKGMVEKIFIGLQVWLVQVAPKRKYRWEAPNYWASVGWHACQGG